jgi:CheY-like chemotaxis protein
LEANQNHTILYVDDDRDDQEIFVEVLNEIRPHVKCQLASDGVEALALLREIDPPICIYLDLNMPIMNGLEVLRKIKADVRLKDIPTFILTTSRNHVVESEARKLGVTDYLTKPSDYNQFKKMLDACLLTHARMSIS